MIPGLSTYNDTPIELPSVCLLELGEQTAEFDSLPYGLCKPQTLKFKLAWSLLPDAFQSQMGIYTTSGIISTWVLESDRGTDGATYYVEYAGCEDTVEAVQLEPMENGEYAYSVELVDVVYHAMKRLNGNDVYATTAGNFTSPDNETFQILLRSLVGKNQKHTGLNGGKIKGASFTFLINVLRSALSTKLKNQYLRTSVSVTNLFDVTQALKNIPVTTAEFYKMGLNGEPRVTTTAITSPDDLYFTTDIIDKNNTRLGGLLAVGDAYGWARRDVSVYDLLRDFAETFAVKISYSLDVVTSPGRHIVATFYVKRVAGSVNHGNTTDTPDATISMDLSLVSPQLTIRGDNINKTEVRFETSREDDAKEIVRLNEGARASRSLNIEPIVHNIPVWLKEYEKRAGRTDIIKQTNLIYFKDTNDSFVKVHETTKLAYGPDAAEYVKVSTAASENPAAVKADLSNEPLQRVQLAAMQSQSSISAALCAFGLHVFSNNLNAIAEMEFDYRTNTALLTKALAGCHELTDGPAVYFTNLAWTRALPTSISVDWTGGKTKIKYYMLSSNTTLELT